MSIATLLLGCSLGVSEPACEARQVHIVTSDLLQVAQTIARGEGYDITDSEVYSFDLLDSAGKPLLPCFASIGFYINGSIRSTISISKATGQSVDLNTCEVFEYPSLLPFQARIQRLTRNPRMSAETLAEVAGCSSLRVVGRSDRPPARSSGAADP